MTKTPSTHALPPETTNEKPPKDKKLFLTTTDLMKAMNRTLNEGWSDELEAPDHKFELHVKDRNTGVTRPADEAQTAVADMQSKIRQSAYEVQDLSSEEKLEWGRQQRREGNEFFRRKDYREAMEVYVTCLVAANIQKDEKVDRDQLEFVLPIMTNLAVCAVKLREFKKARSFCSFAFDLLSKSFVDGDKDQPSQVVKLWFLKGKANMGMGFYSEAREDFRSGLACSSCTEEEANDIRRELRKLVQLNRAAKSNCKKQKLAMQSILGGKLSKHNISNTNCVNKSESSLEESSGVSNLDPVRKERDKPGDHNQNEMQEGLYGDLRKRRTFSKLRDKKLTPKISPNNEQKVNFVPQEDVSSWYLYVLAPVLNCLKWLFVQQLPLRTSSSSSRQKNSHKYETQY